MFFYIRWFSGISFVCVLISAFFVGQYLKTTGDHDLKSVVESSNKALGHVFINTTWKAYRERVTAATNTYDQFLRARINFNEWKNYQGYPEMLSTLSDFNREVFKHFEDVSIAGVDIYTPDGIRLVSVNQSNAIIGQQNSNGDRTPIISADPPRIAANDEAFKKALTGEETTEELGDQPISQPNGREIKKGTVIKTYVPIIKDNLVSVVESYNQPGTADIVCGPRNMANCVEGVMIISYDSTSQWKDLDLFRYIGIACVLVIFIALISMLLFISNRAETIITKQYETNIELAAQTASAQAENRDKSQFLANVSHELRTPLNAIIGFSEFIKMERSGPIGNDKYAEYIRDIHGSGVHLLSLINDILDYSKAEADKLELDVSEMDVTKTVRNSMRLVSPRAETAQVQLIEEIPSDHFVIKTDGKKLKQVLLNLLSNAVKFTPSGGSVTVTMWQNVVDGSLSIEVRDTGIGIAPKDISRAMAPFGQVDNTLSRKYEGTGLGLPLTRKFVEIMGGTFNIQSEVGKGTAIIICLPREVRGKSARVEPEPEKVEALGNAQ